VQIDSAHVRLGMKVFVPRHAHACVCVFACVCVCVCVCVLTQQNGSPSCAAVLRVTLAMARGHPGVRGLVARTCARPWQARSAGEGDWASSSTLKWRIHSAQSSLVTLGVVFEGKGCRKGGEGRRR
jgi:hypothetical protein